METTHDRDGFEFTANIWFEPAENGLPSCYEFEVVDCRVTSFREMVEAYGEAEALIMFRDLETWIERNEYERCTTEFSEEYERGF